MDEPSPLSADDGYDFTPVVTASTRCDGWTADRQRCFIAALAELDAVAAAARVVGMTAQSANRVRNRAGADSFAAAWDAAIEEGRLRAHDEAVRRGIEGWVAPVTRNGRIVRHRRRFDNRLLFVVCYGRSMRRFERGG